MIEKTSSGAKKVEKRYDFILLFDCLRGSPNSNPDTNGPRLDNQTMFGLVSDVCLKRKIRNYIAEAMKGVPGYRIFVQKGVSLETYQAEPYQKLEALKDKEKKQKKDKVDKDCISMAREYMCREFFDNRTFGAVMATTAFNCGQVEGPVQITFARSIDPVFPEIHPITRMAYTTEEKRLGTNGETEMGSKTIIPYGLYQSYGFISRNSTGFSEEDLAILWKALLNMWDMDRSASRGLMATQKLVIFEHESSLGESPANKLFDLVKISKKEGVEFPRSFSDYNFSIDEKNLPKGVKLTVL